MDCAKARRMLDQGSSPELPPEQRAWLDTHLGRCAACRAYRGRGRRPFSLPPLVLALFAAALLLVAGAGLYAWNVWTRTIHNIDAWVVTPAPAETSPTPAGPHTGLASLIPLPMNGAAGAPSATPPGGPDPAAGQAINILLLGTDRRPGERNPGYTDAILLVRVDARRQRVALLSLTRDIVAPIPGFGSRRINAAYQLGERSGAPGGGMLLARRTVSNLLGVPIDYTVLVDFAGFTGLINTLGGVVVDVEKELYDAQFPTMDYGTTVAHFFPGPQLMDGSTALIYSRIRHPDSDFQRVRRQQQVLLAIGARLRERGSLQNLLAADQITGSLVGFVRTDMPRDRIVALVWALRGMDLAAVERYSVREDMVSLGIGSDQFAQVPASASLADLASAFMGRP